MRNNIRLMIAIFVAMMVVIPVNQLAGRSAEAKFTSGGLLDVGRFIPEGSSLVCRDRLPHSDKAVPVSETTANLSFASDPLVYWFDFAPGQGRAFTLEVSDPLAQLGMVILDETADLSAFRDGTVTPIVQAEDVEGCFNLAYTNTSGDMQKLQLVVWMISEASDAGVIVWEAPLVTPSNPSIIINSNDAYTTSVNVTLALAADGLETGAEMDLSDDGTHWQGWQTYASSHAYTLPTGDGSKAVYVRFRNSPSEVSDTATDSITLDSTAPTGSIVIASGASFTGTTAVSLALTADDGSGAGVADMCISNTSSCGDAWEDFSTTKAWSLTSGDSLKTVYAWFRDTLGNVSSPYTDTITLDTTAPTSLGINIDGGAAYTNTLLVDLALSASDGSGSGVYQMCISNTGSCSSWEAYATTKIDWSLTAGEGLKTVYVSFTDNLGNTSGNVSDQITLDQTAPTGTVTINGGDSFTASRNVTLTLAANDGVSGVSQMCISDSTSCSAWENYSTSKTWTVSAGDGLKTVYARFRDVAGNASASPSTDTITLDQTAPSGTISIAGGAAYTTTTNVTLTLTASDGTGVGGIEMRFSDDGATWGGWVSFAASYPYTLPTGDGLKPVYVQYRDSLGNTGGAYSDTIRLDQNGPTGSITINAGAAYTANTSVTLTLAATDAGSSVSTMEFTNNGGVNWSAPEAYATTKVWTITAGDGLKTVGVRYRDLNGNYSSIYSDTITLDLTGPSGTITINSGNLYTSSLNVTLTLSATDGGSGLGQMSFSNDGITYSTWETYAISKVWALADSDGTKSVYVKYRDILNNEGTPVSDTIILDRVAPSGTVVINSGNAYTGSTGVTLTLSAADGGGSGLYQMSFSNDGVAWSSWENYAGSKAWTLTSGDGLKTVYVRFNDNAGNISSNATDTITLDQNAPTGTVIINSGAAFTGSATVTLTLTANDGAGAGGIEMCISNTTNCTTWVAFAPTVNGHVLENPTVDGAKTVYVTYRDSQGNTMTAAVTDTITLDLTAPVSGIVVINDVGGYTSTTTVNLTLSAADGAGSGVTEMCISNTTTCTTWEAYAISKAWTLTAGDGLKTVSVWYRDGVGNTTTVAVTDTTTLDQTAPVNGSVVITDVNGFTTTTIVNLTLNAADGTGSGVTQMCISNTTTCTTWEAYAISKAWTLSTGDGLKTVSAWYRDAAGNTTIAAVTDTTTLDQVAPVSGSVVITDTNGFTNVLSVTLTISASDGAGSGVTQMCVSNTTTCTTWEVYAVSKIWALTAGDGLKTVSVWFQDGVGNITAVAVTDTTTLDQTAPVSGTVVITDTNGFTNLLSVTLTLSALDGTGSGVAQMCISNTTTCTTWEVFAITKVWALVTGDGLKTVSVWFRDGVGNTTTLAVTDTTTLDQTTPVSGTVVITDTNGFTNLLNVTLTLSALDGTGSGVTQMCISNTTTCTTWEVYAVSKIWALTAGDGLKTVSVWYQDAAGNTTIAAVTDTTTLDQTAPVSGTVVITDTNGFTNLLSVTLTLSALDGTGSGVAQMCISNTTTCTTWEAYVITKVWALTAGDGLKTVSVWYRDVLGNTTTLAVTDTTTLDQTPPSCSVFRINNGAQYVNTLNVTLNLTCSDGSGSGVSQVHLSHDNLTFMAWQAYSATIPWTLQSGADGIRQVYMGTRDSVGNVNIAPNYYDSIIYDVTPPTGSAHFSPDNPFTTSSPVTIQFSASDANGVAQRRIFRDGVVAVDWTPYSPGTSSVAIALTGEGSHTVCVQFSDNAGNLTGENTICDSIIFDTLAPDTEFTQPAATGGEAIVSNFTFFMSWHDKIAGTQVSYSIEYRVELGTWQVWQSGVTITNATFNKLTPSQQVDGVNIYFRIRGVDIAGHSEAYPTGYDLKVTVVLGYQIYLPSVMRK